MTFIDAESNRSRITCIMVVVELDWMRIQNLPNRIGCRVKKTESAHLWFTATITQAGFGSQTLRSGTVAFKTLCCAIEVAYIFASVKAITIKFLVWENTIRKELHPLGLTSKVTTEFAFNGTSRGLHKERYCRIDIISELKCM